MEINGYELSRNFFDWSYEIPELEKKDIETIPKAMKKFCRENKLIFANSSNVIFLDGTPHFLFEKL